MIDIHTHVLPDLDDGPADMAGSVAMAEVAVAAGAKTLVATPHVREDHPKVTADQIQARALEANRIIRDYGIDLFIVPGAEVALGRAMGMSDRDLRRVTFAGNGRDLLIETPYHTLSGSFEDVLAKVAGRGFRITLAHPELNPTFQADPERLGRIAESGVLVQVTARSLAGSRRSRSRALAQLAIERGWVHVVASDAHSAEWRPPDMNPGLDAARRALPEASAELAWMVDDVPLALIQGAELPPRPARAPAAKRRAWLRRR